QVQRLGDLFEPTRLPCYLATNRGLRRLRVDVVLRDRDQTAMNQGVEMRTKVRTVEAGGKAQRLDRLPGVPQGSPVDPLGSSIDPDRLQRRRLRGPAITAWTTVTVRHAGRLRPLSSSCQHQAA